MWLFVSKVQVYGDLQGHKALMVRVSYPILSTIPNVVMWTKDSANISHCFEVLNHLLKVILQ